MPVLPFHRYIGPGNKIESGEPVDDDDRIAKIHDIKYENAKTKEEIRKADVEAILQFRKNWMEGNWHSVIGDLGLSLKYFVETYTGVIYPEIDEIKCHQITIRNVLKFHCVFKDKLYDKYAYVVWDTNINNYLSYDFVPLFEENRFDGIFSNFIYVPIEWLDVFKKSNSCLKCQKFHKIKQPQIKMHDFNNHNFNLNLWVRIFKNVLNNKINKETINLDEDFNTGFLD